MSTPILVLMNQFGEVSQNYVLSGTLAGTYMKETFVLDSTNISNGYVDLAQLAMAASLVAVAQGYGPLIEGASYDYSLSHVGDISRFTFLNNVASGGASAFQVGDILQINYQYDGNESV